MAAVLKTVWVQARVGSNPTSTAWSNRIVVDCAGLLNRYTERYRKFESYLLRVILYSTVVYCNGLLIRGTMVRIHLGERDLGMSRKLP